MNPSKRRSETGLGGNFTWVRTGRSDYTIHATSCTGCFLLFSVILGIFVISWGWTIFLFVKVYPIVFSILLARLGINPSLSWPLILTAFAGCFINLPLFIFAVPYQLQSQRANFELFPLWLLKCWFMPQYRYKFQPCGFVGLNVSGGLIPIVLAIYQFYRVPALPILGITGVVALMSYFMAIVIPGRAIVIRQSRFLMIYVVAAVLAMVMVNGGSDRIDVSVAFAGGVLGTTIGADLLHLKEVCSQPALGSLSIGGAGLQDGILRCGVFALIVAEWLPAVVTWFLALFSA